MYVCCMLGTYLITFVYTYVRCVYIYADVSHFTDIFMSPVGVLRSGCKVPMVAACALRVQVAPVSSYVS